MWSHYRLTILHRGNMTLLDLNLKFLFIIPSLLLALHAALLHYISTFKLLWTMTHRSLSLVCDTSNFPPNSILSPMLLNPKCITAHLSKLNNICQSWDHPNRLTRSPFNTCLSSFVPTLATKGPARIAETRIAETPKIKKTTELPKCKMSYRARFAENRKYCRKAKFFRYIPRS